MKPNFAVISSVVLLLISSAFGESATDILNEVTSVAEECGDRAAGLVAGTCLVNAIQGAREAEQSHSNYEEEVVLVLKTLSDCLQPFKQLVASCGKDNYVTLLEGLRAIRQDVIQIFGMFDELRDSRLELTCTPEEESKLNGITKTCMEQKGVGKYTVEGKTIFDGFCWWSSGFRSCIQLTHDNASTEDCPRIRAQASVFLDVFDTIENYAENSVAVSRCFNTAAE